MDNKKIWTIRLENQHLRIVYRMGQLKTILNNRKPTSDNGKLTMKMENQQLIMDRHWTTGKLTLDKGNGDWTLENRHWTMEKGHWTIKSE